VVVRCNSCSDRPGGSVSNSLELLMLYKNDKILLVR